MFQFEFEGATLDYNAIYNSSSVPEYIKKLAKNLLQYQYISCGDYYEILDDVEVEEIVNAIDNISSKNLRQFTISNEQQKQDLMHLALLSLMLAAGEGEVDLSPEKVHDYMNAMIAISVVESLHRKGLVLAHRKNYSVLVGDLVIAERKPE